MKVIGTGLSGLVGSRIVELLQGDFSFVDAGIDITKKEDVDSTIGSSDADWVFHFAAQTDVDRAEKERSQRDQSLAWQVNVAATDSIAQACLTSKKHLLYISTDYVFDGKKESYLEEDIPHPEGWYGITKYEGEKRVVSLKYLGLIIRIANPYGPNPNIKRDFVHRIIDRLQNNEAVHAPDDQIFVPTYIDDIAYVIRQLVYANAYGVCHAVGSQALSPFSAAQKIARVYGYDQSLVHPADFASFFSGRAPRPFHAVLKNDKITKLGLRMSSFDEGLARMKDQK